MVLRHGRAGRAAAVVVVAGALARAASGSYGSAYSS